ncbi:hypothetical protein GF420_07310 [candidate division GN15 bacterium]|nr:hypothetical protein [candidate division GN15 bacterium]
MRQLTNILMILLLTSMVVGAASTASADGVRNAIEKHQDRKGHRQAAAGVADDRADLDRLSDLIMTWNDRRKAGADQAELDRLQHQIAVELRRDIAENKAEVARSSKERRQSTRELRSDRRELRDDRRDVREARQSGDRDDTRREKRELRDDRRDRRDDRRDLRDDRRDEAEAQQLLQEKRQVAARLAAIQQQIDRGTGDPESLRAHQMALYNEYLILSQKEIKQGVREMHEDRRELREDRRESREDRRQG